MTKKKLSIWTILWLAWIFAFLGIEIPAAVNKRGGDTLSEHIWFWFSVSGKKRMWLIRRIVLGVFWIIGVGAAHFLFEVSAIWSVILPGLPFGFFIAWSVSREGSPETTKVKAMPFKVNIATIIAAIVAGATAFGATYDFAIAPPDVDIHFVEWVKIITVTLTAIGGAFTQKPRNPWTDARRFAEARKK